MAKPLSPFHVVGKCLGFVLKDGYLPQSLKLEVSGREYWIKIPRAMRESVLQDSAIAVGALVEVWGMEEPKAKGYKLKLELTELKVVAGGDRDLSTSMLPTTLPVNLTADGQTKPSKQRILVCQKSNCWKSGGKQLYETLQSCVSDRGLQVQVQLTGCLKDCKKAPNLVVLPDKSRYHCLRPSAVPPLLDRHFGEGR